MGAILAPGHKTPISTGARHPPHFTMPVPAVPVVIISVVTVVAVFGVWYYMKQMDEARLDSCTKPSVKRKQKNPKQLAEPIQSPIELSSPDAKDRATSSASSDSVQKYSSQLRNRHAFPASAAMTNLNESDSHTFQVLQTPPSPSAGNAEISGHRDQIIPNQIQRRGSPTKAHFIKNLVELQPNTNADSPR
ncbi:uncharacterized protein EI90DRAFT_3159677 [Cantharellus anzutake]|uniref:uncharacterized protein n=1 Tax=Cantharellus anzutake TaxID=1750568 RepID=UPI0019083267|nr:uncharacterized protein EI90DRAFT_3159677 [Cantharellus anzutake]KAF8313551.1 hypothetical protein EI90DRAFT_3159677 [Cantharellus anzutake]